MMKWLGKFSHYKLHASLYVMASSQPNMYPCYITTRGFYIKKFLKFMYVSTW